MSTIKLKKTKCTTQTTKVDDGRVLSLVKKKPFNNIETSEKHSGEG